MRVRATASARPLFDARRRARGFTLVEILVIVVVVAVLAAVATLGVSSVGGERTLARDAERFEALVRHACEQAELLGRDIGVRIDADGYAFTMLAFEGWQADQRDGELRARTWSPGTQVELLRDGRALDPLARHDDAPAVVCFASGELSPFVLRLAHAGIVARHELRVTAAGRLVSERTETRP